MPPEQGEAVGDFFSDIYSWLQQRLTQIGEGNFVWALAATVALILAGLVVAGLLRFVFRRVDRRLESWEGTHLKAVRLQRQELLSAEDTTRIARGSVRTMTWVVYALLAYMVLQLIFLTFPATRALGTRLLASLGHAAQAAGQAIVAYLPNLVLLAVLFFLTTRAVKLVGLVFRGIQIGRIKIAGFDSDWARPTFKIMRFLIWVFFLVIAFPYLPGSESPAFRGVTAFIGVLLSLGSIGTAANFISGVMLTYTRAFRIGDRVRIGDVEGIVTERTLFVTRVKTRSRVVVTVPNSMVMTCPVENFAVEGRTGGVFVEVTITIGYDVPWRTVHETLLAAAAKTENIEEDPPPFVLQRTLGDFSIAYELNAATRQPATIHLTESGLLQNIQDAFADAGIEIMSPDYLALRDGNDPTVPSESRREGPAVRAFRFLGLNPQ